MADHPDEGTANGREDLMQEGEKLEEQEGKQKELFEIGLSADRMAMLLDCSIPPDGLEEVVLRVRAELTAMKITDEQALNEAVRGVRETGAEQDKLINFVLFEGTPPVPGKDGYIEWGGDFFTKGFVVDPDTGTVDYRQRAAKLSVSAGQLLARIIPPIEGKEGVDALGKVVHPRKPRTVHLRPGANTRYDEDEDAFYATADGRVRYAGTLLAVDDIFHVPGSVGLETGHIKHPGALVVAQNIESGSKVEAEGDIEVAGYIESADLVAGGNLLVRGGISGEGGKLRIGGSVHARFIQNTDIEAGGDIVVEREIDQCAVKCRGEILIPSGRIIGGEAMALKGIEVAQTGSEACVRTSLVTGVDYTVKERIQEKEEDLEQKQAVLKRISTTLAPFRDRNRPIPARNREAVARLLREAKSLTQAVAELEAQIEGIRAESKEDAVRRVLVRAKVCPESAFQILGLTLIVREEVPGPLKVAVRDGDIRLLEAHVDEKHRESKQRRASR